MYLFVNFNSLKFCAAFKGLPNHPQIWWLETTMLPPPFFLMGLQFGQNLQGGSSSLLDISWGCFYGG